MDDARRRNRLAPFARLTFDLRLIALLLTVLWLVGDDAGGAVAAVLVLAAAPSIVPLLRWERMGAVILRHPAFLLVDLGVAVVGVLVLGADSPFLYFVIGTALLTGLLYGPVGASVLGGLLAGLTALALDLRRDLVGGGDFLDQLLGAPALLLLAAAGGAALARVLERGAAADEAAGAAMLAETAASERARLAREMHDSVAKTLRGISLTAVAVESQAATDAEGTRRTARVLAEAADRAAVEARQLITDLRVDDLDRDLAETLRRTVERWADREQVEVDLDLDPCGEVGPSVRYELFAITREALANVAAHADARRVRVRLTTPTGADGEPLVRLEIADDGRGFAPPDDLAGLADDQHFGLVGMHERAGRVGGEVEVSSGRGAGTTVRVLAPALAPGAPETRRAETIR